MRRRIYSDLLRTRFGIALLALTAVVLLWTLIVVLRPLPGRELTMATGAPGSEFARVGEKYREILARDGVRLHLLTTEGAVENSRLLGDPASGVGVGFVIAGVTEKSARQHLSSLGTLFYVEMWVFCRCPERTIPMRGWNGWRVSIGPKGNGTNSLARELLTLNGIDGSKLQLFDYNPETAAQALLDKKLDAALILTGWKSPVVQRLLHTPGITLLGFPRADAYVALDPSLSRVLLPMGVVDLEENQPAEDIPLIASKASLAVRQDLHPALQFLLLRAAIEVHSSPAVFQRPGEFPAAEGIDLTLSQNAWEFYRAGPTFLERSLPFWLAELMQRLLILILPIAGIIYPLWSLAPKAYYWLMQRRLTALYRELRSIDHELRKSAAGTRGEFLSRLDDLERRARDLPMPGLLSQSTYSLWAYIQGLRERAYGKAE
jgi:TRAP-type uncharacterized transport system substrate-binding protein